MSGNTEDDNKLGSDRDQRGLCYPGEEQSPTQKNRLPDSLITTTCGTRFCCVGRNCTKSSSDDDDSLTFINESILGFAHA